MWKSGQMALVPVAGFLLLLGGIGCQPERPDVVPTAAQLSVSGNGVMHYAAPADGTLFLYDRTTQRLIWSGSVVKGQGLDVDPQGNRIMVDGTIVENKLSAGADQKEIYFSPQHVPRTSNNGSEGVSVTPTVTVHQNDETAPSSGVIVQPGVQVTPLAH